MTVLKHLLRTVLLLGALAAAAPAFAHGLLVSVRGEGSDIVGRVYYSDGTAGAGEFVELRDLTQPDSAAQSAAADARGAFRFPGVQGRLYAVVAHGEEGHTTEMQLTLVAGERGRLVEAPSPTAGFRAPPAWAVVGGLLLLSAIPALWLRRRRSPEPQTRGR